MNQLTVYTKVGEKKYADVLNSMHLGIVKDGVFLPLRNDTGVLFPRADLSDGTRTGTTRTLISPWIFRRKGGGFGVVCTVLAKGKSDRKTRGGISVFLSDNGIRYQPEVVCYVAKTAVKNPRCVYDESLCAYYLEWETAYGSYCGVTADFVTVKKQRLTEPRLTHIPSDLGADYAVGNSIGISDSEYEYFNDRLGVIYNTGVKPIACTHKKGEPLHAELLPDAVFEYSDGSNHAKKVEWSASDISAIDCNVAGEYTVCGTVRQKHYPFPFVDGHVSDPDLVRYNGRYYLTYSGQRAVRFRIGKELSDLKPINEHIVYEMPASDPEGNNMWAPELHFIDGTPYIFTTVGRQKWYTVQSCVLRCRGDIENPADWEAPRLVVKKDGSVLEENGISLDMTYFADAGRHYVMWSNRVIRKDKGEPADVYIATVDPNAPWQLTSDPVCVMRPVYGWDRLQTEVDEGPFLLRRKDDLFVTVSGSSTAVPDLYCLGLLHAKSGADLLDPASWDVLGFPVLTKESVAGEYGPGHNSFIKDEETGDDLMVYHAVWHGDKRRRPTRRMAIRRVHWTKSGYPYFEMTEERDVAEKFRQVVCKITVE